jgi:hypothetical protein
VYLFLLLLSSIIFAQGPYLIGDTVLPEDNLSWTDNTGYTTNIFDEISVKQNAVVIFWGSTG